MLPRTMQTTRYPFESTLSEARELNRPCIKLIVKRAKHYKYRLSIDMIESFQEEKHLDRDASLELVATLMTGSSLPHGRVGRWDTVVEPRSSFHLVSYETLDDAIRIGQSVFDVLTNAKCDGGAYYRSRLRGDADLQEMVDLRNLAISKLAAITGSQDYSNIYLVKMLTHQINTFPCKAFPSNPDKLLWKEGQKMSYSTWIYPRHPKKLRNAML